MSAIYFCTPTRLYRVPVVTGEEAAWLKMEEWHGRLTIEAVLEKFPQAECLDHGADSVFFVDDQN
ncbi:hypothetical protein IMW82_13590 [Rhodanobacter sp. B2A1Ga4]|uniref:hypothetical protein n=1 Tax=Rhodanobacter sp. B2A1Ga4 TaxID=2778647 RepID=UPI001B38954F|nr:hypothetical protein [Rhodanobacter sp. B2A1Ga4]MBQ4855705.1 hypothetical protein [Rhodanobacter sp. B2A1Ga4]